METNSDQIARNIQTVISQDYDGAIAEIRLIGREYGLSQSATNRLAHSVARNMLMLETHVRQHSTMIERARRQNDGLMVAIIHPDDDKD